MLCKLQLKVNCSTYCRETHANSTPRRQPQVIFHSSSGGADVRFGPYDHGGEDEEGEN